MNGELFDREDIMSDDSYMCFMRALRENVGRGQKRSQVSLASEIGVTPGHMNRIYNERDGLRAPYNLQLKIVEALGYKHREFLDLGRKLLNGGEVQEEDEQPQHRGKWPNDYLTFIDVISITRELQSQLSDFSGEFGKVCAVIQDNYRKVDSRMEFWRGVVNHLPIAMCIIRDGIVIWQNKKSLKWGAATGSQLCFNCIDKGCSAEGGTCAIKESIETGIEASEIKEIDGFKYRVDAYPIVSEAHEYAIVTAAQVEIYADEEGEQ